MKFGGGMGFEFQADTTPQERGQEFFLFALTILVGAIG